MNKSVIAGAIIIALGGGAFAGMSIADGKIKELYNQPSIGIVTNIKTTQNLGMMGGTVEWTADLALDPCHPEDVLSFQGTDTISKGLTGYTIRSEFKPVLTDEKLKAVFEKMPALQAETSFNWSGNGKTTISLPAHELNEDENVVKWDKISATSRFSLKGNDVQAEDLQASMPNVSINSGGVTATLKGVSYETNVPMLGSTIRSGNGSMKVQSFGYHDKDASFTAENFAVDVEQKVNGDKVNTGVKYSLGTFEMKDKESSLTIQDTKVNVKFVDVQRQPLEKIMQVLDQSTKECIKPADATKRLEGDLIALANAGFKIESKDNQFKIGDSVTTANAEVVAPTHTYTDINDITNKLPTLVTYQLNVELNKSLLRNIAPLTGRKVTDEELDATWQQIIVMSGGKVDGDRLVIERKSP